MTDSSASQVPEETVPSVTPPMPEPSSPEEIREDFEGGEQSAPEE